MSNSLCFHWRPQGDSNPRYPACDADVLTTRKRKALHLLCLNDIPESKINDTPYLHEVIDVLCDHYGTDLACQKGNTNIIVLSWICRIQLSKGSELLAGTPDFDLGGWLRLDQAPVPAVGIEAQFVPAGPAEEFIGGHAQRLALDVP